MGIFKLLKKTNLLYKHCIFIFSPGQTKDGHLIGSRDFFSFPYCDNNSQCTRVHYTHSFSRETNRTRVINCVLLYHIIELLKFSAWIIQSPYLLHQYDYILHACPQSSTMCLTSTVYVFVYISGVSLSGHTILVTYDSRATKWIYSRYILNN